MSQHGGWISLVIFGSRDTSPGVAEIDGLVAELLGARRHHIGPRLIGEVLCGMARGADLAGKFWAERVDVPVIEMPADWSRDGKIAGYRRNAAMAARATHGLGFWRRWSHGTAHMATCLVALGKPVKIVEQDSP